MSSAIDKLVNDAACLRIEVAQLRGEVTALRHVVADQTGELLALRLMLTTWPVQAPASQQVVR
ncbi:hypothetical protein E2C06_30630 [Dankookia rubra]|uniref:Uncharacterized protein n=1 Tax=Dankookia rubra TaxID=1442381 RepID=A0A4R5Q7W9_9PROT|nr:hypothetical protein [Dankookia rubra]TDH58826.1 hypothetical protein E2C06_30630 [Dankookia rubra]